MKFYKMTLFAIVIAVMLCTFTFAQTEVRQSVQEPKGTTMDLVPFTPKMIGFPFSIQYPAKWYAREEFAGAPSLFLTQEPVRQVTDQYRVGLGLYVMLGVLNSLAGESTTQNWEKNKNELVNGLEDQHFKIIDRQDVKISGQSALRVDCESVKARMINYYIKVNNNLFTMTLECPPQEYEQYKQVFDEMLKSFTFTR